MLVVGIGVAAVAVGQRAETAPPTAPAVPGPAAEASTETVPGLDAPAEPLPALLPLPARLREEGGVLWWSSEDCRVGSVALASGEVSAVEGEHCRVWPAPAGGGAVVATTAAARALSGGGLLRLRASSAAPTEPGARTEGLLGSELVWSGDGGIYAVCLGTRNGPVVELVGLNGERAVAEGACSPGWLADGRLALARPGTPSVEVEGTVLLGPGEIGELLPSVPRGARRTVSALGADGGRIAVGLVVVDGMRPLPHHGALAVLGEEGTLLFAASLRPDTLPAAIALSPDGSALWYHDAGKGTATILSLPGGRRFPPFGAGWVAWSPSGRYLAATSPDGIVLSAWPEGERIAVVPVLARDVAWAREP